MTDYCGEREPAAASLLDLVRATVVFEEPYALACFVKYVQKTLRVVRLKNRFENDVAERVSAARLQQEFYAAEAWGYDDADSIASGDSGREAYDKMYRDVMLNVEVPREGGDPFIAELQVTLSGISILKKSEQTVYSIMRMKRPADLLDTFVFDREDIGMPQPRSPKLEGEESVVLPISGPFQPLPAPGNDAGKNDSAKPTASTMASDNPFSQEVAEHLKLSGVEETAATESMVEAQTLIAMPRAALAAMSDHTCFF